MTQAPDQVRLGRDSSLPGTEFSRPIESQSPRWLALADMEGSADLRRLVPGIEVGIEESSSAFFKALAAEAPELLILVSPPAGPADLWRATGWLARHRGSCAVLMKFRHSVGLRLFALGVGFDDTLDPDRIRAGMVSFNFPTDPGWAEERSTNAHRIAIGEGIEFDRLIGMVRRDGRLVSLRPKEVALLDFFVSHPSQVFTREELLCQVWEESSSNVRTVDVHVYWLRGKIERDAANPTSLLTVRGRGYMFLPWSLEPAVPVESSRTPNNVKWGPTPR